jgi:hypothetical protein
MSRCARDPSRTPKRFPHAGERSPDLQAFAVDDDGVVAPIVAPRIRLFPPKRIVVLRVHRLDLSCFAASALGYRMDHARLIYSGRIFPN